MFLLTVLKRLLFVDFDGFLITEWIFWFQGSPLSLVCLAVAAERELPSRARGGWAAFGVTSSEVMVSCGDVGTVCSMAGDGKPGFFLLYLKMFSVSPVQLFHMRFLHIVLVKPALLSHCSQVGRYLKVLLFQLSCYRTIHIYLSVLLVCLCYVTLYPCIKGPECHGRW